MLLEAVKATYPNKCTTATINFKHSYFERPNATNIEEFLANHPIQPYDVTSNPAKTYFPKREGEKFRRNWVSYCRIDKKVHRFWFPGFLFFIIN